MTGVGWQDTLPGNSLIEVNRSERRVVFLRGALEEHERHATRSGRPGRKRLLWLRGDTSRWEVHYAFFARNFGQMEADIDQDSVHLFTPVDVIGA